MTRQLDIEPGCRGGRLLSPARKRSFLTRAGQPRYPPRVTTVELINTPVVLDGVEAVLLLIEFDANHTVVELRVTDAMNARVIAEHRLDLLDAGGMSVAHIATHSGGSGLEMHVSHVFQATPPNQARLVTREGELLREPNV